MLENDCFIRKQYSGTVSYTHLWVEKAAIYDLNLWEGDKIFLRLLEENPPFFSLKLVYDTDDVLQYVALDGKRISHETLDIR